jgi:hypothetical protein
MEGGQVGIRRDTRAIKRIMFVDNRDLILFNHGNKIMNVEDNERRGFTRNASRGGDASTRPTFIVATWWPPSKYNSWSVLVVCYVRC